MKLYNTSLFELIALLICMGTIHLRSLLTSEVRGAALYPWTLASLHEWSCVKEVAVVLLKGVEVKVGVSSVEKRLYRSEPGSLWIYVRLLE